MIRFTCNNLHFDGDFITNFRHIPHSKHVPRFGFIFFLIFSSVIMIFRRPILEQHFLTEQQSLPPKAINYPLREVLFV